MCAGAIRLLLYFYAFVEDSPDVGTVAYRVFLGQLKGRELVSVLGEPDELGRRIVLTPRGLAYAAMLMATPLPDMRWVDPREERS